MAIKISDSQNKFAFSNAYYIPNFGFKSGTLSKILKITLIVFFSKIRKLYIISKFFKKFLKGTLGIYNRNNKKIENNFSKIQCTNLQPHSSVYLKKGWCFIQNFLDPKSYNIINSNWPSSEFF